MGDVTPLVVANVQQQIFINIHGGQATIKIVGLNPLQVIMLLSQFTNMIAGQIKSQTETPRIIIPDIMVKP